MKDRNYGIEEVYIMSNKLKEKTCKFCGKKFTGASNRLTCGSEECKRLLDKQRNKKPGTRIRPYTKTSVIMISRDLKEGLSIEEMARIYDRDVEDLRRFVEKIKKAGIVDYINKKLDKYHQARSHDISFARHAELDINLRKCR